MRGVEIAIEEDERILVRGPSLFDGFWREPSPLDARGFYDTGDHGRWDDAGSLHVLGRRTDLIVSGGENVYPAEVEGALEAIDGIEAACVFGSPDAEWGEAVCALCIASSRTTTNMKCARREAIAIAVKRVSMVAPFRSAAGRPGGLRRTGSAMT